MAVTACSAATPGTPGTPVTTGTSLSTTSAANTSSSSTPRRAPAAFKRVVIDGWQYGAAWVGFHTDTGTPDDPTTPGFVRASVDLVFTYDQPGRTTEPAPTFISGNLGFGFYANSPATIASCGDPTATSCQLAGGCQPGSLDADVQPVGTVVRATCVLAGEFTETITRKDFKVDYEWMDDQATTKRAWLKYQG